MHHYPVFLSLAGKDCLVVGGGKVGVRKLATLLEAGADTVTVLDVAEPSPELAALAEHAAVTLHQRSFQESDLDGKFLVIAATTNANINSIIATLCHSKGILCNIADAPEKSSFIVPSCVKRGDLRVAISTGGHSPALSRRLRRELETVFGPEYEQLTAIMGKIRPMILERNMKTENNTALFRALVESGLLTALAEEDLDRAASHLREILPVELHDRIGDILHAST